MKFGESLKELRLNHGLSQRELGERLGVSQQTVAQYERAEDPPKMKTIKRLADAMGMDSQEILAFAAMSQINNLLDKYKEQGLYEPEPMPDIDDFHCIDENAVLTLVDQLNYAGLARIYDHLVDLTKIPEYRKQQLDTSEEPAASALLAAHARTDVEQTPEGIQHDLDIMNDDKRWK